MEKIRILSIGYSIEKTYSMICDGDYPSQLLYGMFELDKNKYNVDYFSIKKGIRNLFQNLYILLFKKYDILYIPYLDNSMIYLFILLLKTLKVYRNKIVCVQHFNPYEKFNQVFKNSFKHLEHVFFLSDLNRKDTIKKGWCSSINSSVLPWGVELNFYRKYDLSFKYNNTFISTGIENRDYELLVKLFKNHSNCNLLLFIPYGKKDELNPFYDCSNIHVVGVKQNKDTVKYLIEQICKCTAVIIPLKNNQHYCVGLTCLVEALALGKPILTTLNTYYPVNVDESHIGYSVPNNDMDAWESVINKVLSNKENVMNISNNAMNLAEKSYNINKCSIAISSVFTSLL